MGAWGEGLQANDTALDYISIIEDYLKENKIEKLTKKVVEEIMEKAKDMFNDGYYSTEGVLGLAEWLLDKGVKPSWLHVKKALKSEMSPDQLECWEDHMLRREVLVAFGRRLEGKETKADKESHEYHNRGLFCRIAEHLGE